MHVEPPPALISQYVHGKRILPQDTPFPGPMDVDKIPYTKEIMDCLAPSSPITHVALMKGVQLGATATAENVIGYYMDPCPAPIMILSATDDAIKAWGGLRLEPLIDSLGIRDKLGLSNYNSKSRASGDTAERKNFSGGYIVLGSAQAPAKLRSFPIRVLIRDEIDGAPAMLITGEGNFLDVSEGRTNSFGAIKKIFDLSTPTTLENSLINQQYEKGDKRKYYVPCPHCNELQILEFGGDKLLYGLKPVFDDDGVLTRVFYQCKHCHGEIENYHKTEMLAKGKWKATAKSYNGLYRSYHISSLYSPVGMFSWFDLYQKYLEAKDKPDGMRSFVNLCLGLPYRETGSRPKLKNILELTGTYRAGTVPDGVLFLTAGIDVQSGKNSRLEMEVRGHGRLWRTWSICYLVFEGAVDNPLTGAWKKLADFFNDGGNVYPRSDGVKMPIKMTFIDSGDGNGTDTVYQFCKMRRSVYPIKGRGVIKKDKKKTGDAIDTHNFWPWKTSNIDSETTLVNISTNYYKRNIYNSLNNSFSFLDKIRKEGLNPDDPEIYKLRPAGFSDFPLEYGEKYFNMLTAEELRTDGSFHAGGRRNEALDCAVYNAAAGSFFLSKLLSRLKLELKSKDVAEHIIDDLTTDFAMDWLEKNPT